LVSDPQIYPLKSSCDFKKKLFFYHGARAPSGLGPRHYRGFTIARR